MCAWSKNNPSGSTKIKDSDDEIRANNADLETVLGTNLTSGPTSIQDAILLDGTKQRHLRLARLKIDNGTNAATLKCTVTSKCNGDAIAETDNIAKNATTGNFSLDADGYKLTIEAAGLTGNAIGAFGVIDYTAISANYVPDIGTMSNDVTIYLRDNAGTAIDLTTMVDTGITYITFFYITDA